VTEAAGPVHESPARPVSPEEYTREDDRLLQDGVLAARTAVLSGGALSVGVSQREDSACIQRARKMGIPVVRRSTGGLGLWHAPGDVVWSIVLPRAHPLVGHDFSRAYARLGLGVVRFLAARNVQAKWQPPVGGPGEYCLLSGAGSVLAVNGRAAGGAAQHLTRQALLHHGVLPYRVDHSRLSDLFDLSAELADRTLTSLDELTHGAPAPELATQLRLALASVIGES